MYWLKNDKNGVVNFDQYFNYIESVKESLPLRVYGFASNWDMYSLESPSSLHDSWMESFYIKEDGKGNRKQVRECTAKLALLGAFHDRRIILEYSEVQSYTVHSIELTNGFRGHADLALHELRAGDDGSVEHEIRFSNGGYIQIVFGDLVHTEIVLDKS